MIVLMHRRVVRMVRLRSVHLPRWIVFFDDPEYGALGTDAQVGVIGALVCVVEGAGVDDVLD